MPDPAALCTSGRRSRTLKQNLQSHRLRSLPEEDDETETPPLIEHSSEIILYGFSQRTVGTVMVLTIIVTELIGMFNPSEAQQQDQHHPANAAAFTGLFGSK